MQYDIRTCSICETNQFSHVSVTSNVAAEFVSFSELEDSWSGFFKEAKKPFFTYHKCAKCNLLFCPTFFNQNQLSDLYANMADNTAKQDVTLLRKTQKSYYDVFSKYIPTINGDYFELGPDIGLFTENIEPSAYQKIWLAEPNQAVWDVLKTTVQDSQYSLFSDFLTDDPIPDDSLKSAVMIHVLDHLLNPVETLTHLHKKMKKGAILLLVTHDYSSLLSKLLNHRWPAYCLQHPQLFNAKSMKAILDKSKFETLTIKKSYNYFPPGYLLNHLLWSLNVKKITLPSLNFLSFPIKLGNIITIAQKR